MQVIVSAFEPCAINQIIQFRRDVYTASRRDPQQLATWCNDRFDRSATHFLAYSDAGELIGAMRILDGAEWSLDHYFSFSYDKVQGVEFGRLAVSRRQDLNRRVLFELIDSACSWCRQNGREKSYGFVVHRFSRALVRQKVPFEVLSPSISPYGEASNLVRFSTVELEAYYQQRISAVVSL